MQRLIAANDEPGGCELHPVVAVVYRNLVPDVHRRYPERISTVSGKRSRSLRAACSVDASYTLFSTYGFFMLISATKSREMKQILFY